MAEIMWGASNHVITVIKLSSLTRGTQRAVQAGPASELGDSLGQEELLLGRGWEEAEAVPGGDALVCLGKAGTQRMSRWAGRA